MSDKNIKLFTWDKLLILIPAIFIGASLSLFREYRETGGIEPLSLIISGMAVLIGLLIMAVIAWWANKPIEEKDH